MNTLLEFPDNVVQAMTDSDRYGLTSDQQWEQDNSQTRQFSLPTQVLKTVHRHN